MMLRKVEVAVLLRSFSRALGVGSPSLRGANGDEALRIYGAFTAACLQMALEDERTTRYVRRRLGEEAFALGVRLRPLARACPQGAHGLASLLYRGIRIELAWESDDRARFGPCAFAAHYSPSVCGLMSAFDEGFLRGILNRPEARLEFTCRITEGAPCCCARLACVRRDK
ncbi:MAG: hypothetical protein IKF78_04105 [Atopobiaceae bacterium]|nr:hypothetical protein [Atopobiaceae bacterium]